MPNCMAESFRIDKLCIRISSRKVNCFNGKRPLCVFEPPLEDLRATHTVHIRLIGKPIVDFLLVNN